MSEPEFSFKSLFVPFTSFKAIQWIIVIGLVVYINSLFNGFVGDDYGQIVDNNLTHSVINIPAFFTSSTFNEGYGTYGIYYKPLLLTSYSIMYSIFGQNSFFFHLLQLAMHIANTIFTFLLLKKFITKKWAFALSIIFLIHPINESTAVYIANLQDTMFFFFGIMALLFSSSNRVKNQEIIVYPLLALSLLSKETGIVFLIINLTYIYFFQRKRLRNALIFTALLLVPYIIVHYLVVGTSFASAHIFHIGRMSLLERLINIPKIIIYYLKTLLFPNNIAVTYDWVVTRINFLNFYLPLAIIFLFSLVLLLIGKILRHKNSILFHSFLFFAIWFIVGLSFHIQLIPLGGTVSPRWFYFPFVGLLGMIGVTLQQFNKSKRANNILFLLLFIISIIFSIRTIIRNTDFKDNVTLTCHDADETHDNFTLEASCGASLTLMGRYNDAQIYLERSVSLAPYYSTNWLSLGTVIGKKAEINKNRELINQAETDFRIAIKNDPTNPLSYENLGYLYAYYNDVDTARNFLNTSVKIFPKDYKLWLFLAITEYKVNNHQSAYRAIKNSYSLNPGDPEVSQFHFNIINDIPTKIQSPI